MANIDASFLEALTRGASNTSSNNLSSNSSNNNNSSNNSSSSNSSGYNYGNNGETTHSTYDSYINSFRHPHESSSSSSSSFSSSHTPEFNLHEELAQLKIDDFIQETGENGDLESEAWVCGYNIHGLKMYQKRFTKPYICIRECKQIYANYVTVVKLLEDYAMKRRKWDTRLMDSEVIQTYPNENAKVVKVLYAGSFVHRAREIILLEHQISKNGTTFFLQKSVNHPATPKNPRVVRAEMKLSGYMIKELHDSQHGEYCLVALLQQIDPKLMFNRANTEDNLFSNSAKTLGIERLVMPRKISYTMNDERRKRSLKLAKHILTVQNYLNERLIPSTTERPVSLNLQPLSEQLALGSSSSSSSAGSSSDPNLASLPHHVPLTREKSLPKNLPTKSENTEECFLSFTDVLGGLFSRMYFARFLDSEFSAENLDFWLAVQAFKIFSPDEIQEDCFAHVLEIVAAYVVPGAPFQVNLSNNVRVALLERIEKMKQSGDRPSVNIFDDAQRWVFDLMKNDPYRRFLESELYADLLEYLAENGANVHIEMLREFVSDVSVSPDSSTRSSFSGPSNTGGFTTTITPPTPTITTSSNNNFSNHNNNNNSNHHHHNNTTNSNHNSNHNNNHNSNNYNNNNNNGYSSNNSSFNYDDRPEKSQSFDSSSASSSSSSNYQLAPWSLSECFDGTYVFKRVNSKPVRCRRYLRVIEAPADKLWNTLLDMSEKRSRWLQEFVSASVVEIIDHNVQILHVIQTPPFKARKGRDFCILRVVLQDEKISGDKYILYRSITHKACPESKDFSRCKMWTSGFMITPAPSRTNNWNVVFLTQIDWRSSPFERIMSTKDDKFTLSNLQRYLNDEL